MDSLPGTAGEVSGTGGETMVCVSQTRELERGNVKFSSKDVPPPPPKKKALERSQMNGTID